MKLALTFFALALLFVGCHYLPSPYGWIEDNTDEFMDAMLDKMSGKVEDLVKRKAEETLKKFHDNPQFSFSVNRDRVLRYAMEIGQTDIFKYKSRRDDVKKVVCLSKTADFLLKSREEGTITETLVELILYARECHNEGLVVELVASGTKTMYGMTLEKEL